MPWQPDYPVPTDRLRLRPLTPADIPAALVYRSDPEACRYLPFEPMTPEVLATRLAGDLGRTQITEAGQGLTLGAELVDTGELIGDVVLMYHSEQHRGGEIGYVFRPDVTGRGLATEACRAVLDLAFDPAAGLGLHRVTALMDARNTASARLAARLGMRQEAHFRRAEIDGEGEWVDLLVFAVLADEWFSPTR